MREVVGRVDAWTRRRPTYWGWSPSPCRMAMGTLRQLPGESRWSPYVRDSRCDWVLRSGGGFRAAAFHLGVFRKLKELSLLKCLDLLSCVSGGSIAGAHLALNWGKPDAPRRPALGKHPATRQSAIQRLRQCAAARRSRSDSWHKWSSPYRGAHADLCADCADLPWLLIILGVDRGSAENESVQHSRAVRCYAPLHPG